MFCVVYLALGELVMLYTDAINDPDAIPNVEKAWDIYVKKKMADAKQDALEVYNQCMSHLTRLPCDGNNLLENHESSQKKAMEKYLVETAELISTSLKKDLSELTVSASYRRKLYPFLQTFFSNLLLSFSHINLN